MFLHVSNRINPLVSRLQTVIGKSMAAVLVSFLHLKQCDKMSMYKLLSDASNAFSLLDSM